MQIKINHFWILFRYFVRILFEQIDGSSAIQVLIAEQSTHFKGRNILHVMSRTGRTESRLQLVWHQVQIANSLNAE